MIKYIIGLKYKGRKDVSEHFVVDDSVTRPQFIEHIKEHWEDLDLRTIRQIDCIVDEIPIQWLDIIDKIETNE